MSLKSRVCCSAMLMLCAFAMGGQPEATNQFHVTNRLIQPNVQPFTATITAFGNSIFRGGSGFEPVVFRTILYPIEGSEDRIIGRQEDISHWDTLRDGALDGADVRVYRIEQGRFTLVREDRVAVEGFASSGWWPVVAKNQLIAPTSLEYHFQWGRYDRPNALRYFTVRAVGKDGRCSTEAAAVRAKSPSSPAKTKDSPPPTQQNVLVSVKPLACGKAPGNKLPIAPPGNLQARVEGTGGLHLSWDSVTDSSIAGYALHHSDTPPEQHRGFSLGLEGRAKDQKQFIRAGDLVIVSKKFYGASRIGMHSNRVFAAESENRVFMPDLVHFFPDEDKGKTWKLLPHQADTPVDAPGETYLQLQLAPGASESIGAYTHAGTQQGWYPVLKAVPYQMEVWMRRVGPGTVRFKVTGFYDRKTSYIEPVEFHPTGQWQKFTARFTPPAVQQHPEPGRMALEFSGPGVFDIDNFRVFRADTDFLDYSTEEYGRLRQSGMAALRTHALIKTGRRTYDLAQLTNSAGVISAGTRLNTLPQTLSMLKRAEVRPWLQIEPHLSDAEWLGLVEYLAAPYDPSRDTRALRPWAHKRFSQGQEKPWTDVFSTIDVELGNETWNRLFRPWVFTSMTDAATGKVYGSGEVYGLYQEHVIRQMQASPYWAAAGLDKKVRWLIGGWAVSNYGEEALKMSPSSAGALIGAYNGGWDEGKGPPGRTPSSFSEVLAHTGKVAIPMAQRHVLGLEAISTRRAANPLSGTYEAGPGYALDGLNKSKVTPLQAQEQERVMKSLAAGSATLDAFLARLGLGMTLQNFFTFGEGPYWKSHASWHRGGHAYPAWELLTFYNRVLAGSDMVAVQDPSTASNDATNKWGLRSKSLLTSDIAAYAFQRADQLAVVLISRKIPNFPEPGDTGFRPVNLTLPFRSAETLEIIEMQGQYDSHNVERPNVQLVKKTLSAKHLGSVVDISKLPGVDKQGLAPASTMLLVFKGLNTP